MNVSNRFEIFDVARQPSQNLPPPFRPFPPGFNPFDIRNYIGINEGQAGEVAKEGDAGEDANEGRVKNKPTWRCPWPGCQSIKLYAKKGLNSHIAYKHKINGFTGKLELLDSCVGFMKQAIDLKENFGIEVLNENGMDLVKKFNQNMNYLLI